MAHSLVLGFLEYQNSPNLDKVSRHFAEQQDVELLPADASFDHSMTPIIVSRFSGAKAWILQTAWFGPVNKLKPGREQITGKAAFGHQV